MDYRTLKSGSDIRGVAIATKGSDVTLTDRAVSDIVRAFVVWLGGRQRSKYDRWRIAAGHDSRLSADRIRQVVVDKLTASGVIVYDCGLSSTPSMYLMTKHESTDCDAAIMITASHHPYDKNGLKLFCRGGGLEGADIGEILETAHRISGEDIALPDPGLIKKGDYLGLYCDLLIDKIKSSTGSLRPLEGLRIAVDAGNGAGGFFAARVLEPLGANTGSSQFLNPDGSFPNHIPNPEDSEAMASISQRVVDKGADLGIIFDTDVDRAAIVTSSGQEINRNRLIALMSAILLDDSPANPVIVTDSVTSDGLAEFLSARGIKHHRYKRGYKNVINEAIRLNSLNQNALLAIETSGHAALRENYFLDDGAYLVVKILIKFAMLAKEGKSLESLIVDLREPQESKEIRIKLKSKDWRNEGNAIIERLTALAKEKMQMVPDNYEGIRANLLGVGWFLARLSVHDPILVVNIESDIIGGVDRIWNMLGLHSRTAYKN